MMRFTEKIRKAHGKAVPERYQPHGTDALRLPPPAALASTGRDINRDKEASGRLP